MIIKSFQSENEAVINTAYLMAGAARTAPKTKGEDRIETLILTDEDITKISDYLKEQGQKNNLNLYKRDGRILQEADAILLIAVENKPSNLGKICGYCGHDCTTEGNVCSFTSIDLGIAVGSAISVAADNRVDDRVLFSAGKAALELGYFDEEYTQVLAIALASKGKNPFFDRIEQFNWD